VTTLNVQLFDTNIISAFIADVTQDDDYCQGVDLVIGLLKSRKGKHKHFVFINLIIL